jgi:predicted ABC-type ATPase
MTDGVPRLRMFAGPNGSGKSTIKNQLSKPPGWFGIYINPDELELALRTTGLLSPADWGLVFSASEVREYFASSPFLRQQGLHLSAGTIVDFNGRIDFRNVGFNSYHASVLSDFLRRRALAERMSFTFETVMSAPDKVELLGEAQAQGFRTYLYFIGTEDPAINVQRVRNRVAAGGHNVPENKIIERHARSLALLPKALDSANRAFLFDTSGDEPWYFAEVIDGSTVELQTDVMPKWFQPIWDSIPET